MFWKIEGNEEKQTPWMYYLKLIKHDLDLRVLARLQGFSVGAVKNENIPLRENTTLRN